MVECARPPTLWHDWGPCAWAWDIVSRYYIYSIINSKIGWATPCMHWQHRNKRNDNWFCIEKPVASNQAQPLLIWRRDLGLGASKNRRICNQYVFKVVSQNLADRQRVHVGPGAERHNSQARHRCTRACWRCWTPRYWCCMSLASSWTVCLFDVVVSWISSSSLWTSPLRDAESRAAKEHRSCLGRKLISLLSFQLVSRSHWSIMATASFAFDDQSGGILVLLKKNSGSFAPSLSPSLQDLCSFLSCKKKKKKKKGQREDRSSSSGKDRYMRVLV